MCPYLGFCSIISHGIRDSVTVKLYLETYLLLMNIKIQVQRDDWLSAAPPSNGAQQKLELVSLLLYYLSYVADPPRGFASCFASCFAST